MSDFIVRFTGVELSEQATSRIESAIQKAVISEFTDIQSIAKHEPSQETREGIALLLYTPVAWKGKWIIGHRDFANSPEMIKSKLTVKEVSG
jgi:hypothetical protein